MLFFGIFQQILFRNQLLIASQNVNIEKDFSSNIGLGAINPS